MIGHKVEVEASGNVSLENVRAIAETGIDVISVGALDTLAESARYFHEDNAFIKIARLNVHTPQAPRY